MDELEETKSKFENMMLEAKGKVDLGEEKLEKAKKKNEKILKKLNHTFKVKKFI